MRIPGIQRPTSAFLMIVLVILGYSRTIERPPQDVRRIDRKLPEIISCCFKRPQEAFNDPFWKAIYDITPFWKHLKLSIQAEQDGGFNYVFLPRN